METVKISWSKQQCTHKCAHCVIDEMPTRFDGSDYVLITKDGLHELVDLATKRPAERSRRK